MSSPCPSLNPLPPLSHINPQPIYRSTMSHMGQGSPKLGARLGLIHRLTSTCQEIFSTKSPWYSGDTYETAWVFLATAVWPHLQSVARPGSHQHQWSRHATALVSKKIRLPNLWALFIIPRPALINRACGANVFVIWVGSLYQEFLPSELGQVDAEIGEHRSPFTTQKQKSARLGPRCVHACPGFLRAFSFLFFGPIRPGARRVSPAWAGKPVHPILPYRSQFPFTAGGFLGSPLAS